MKVNFDYIDFAEKIIEYKKQLRKKKKKEKIEPSYGLINPWEQSKLEIERLSREFMEELADAINKEVERQIKERNKPDFSKMTTREILEYTYKNEVQDDQ